MDARLEFAIETARAAGEILKSGFGKLHQLRNKGPRDLLTEFDLASEALILERIQQRYPADSVVAEESGLSGHGDYVWFVDPLDGTTNFAHRIPIFSVSIACAVEGQPIVGVVYEPLRDELFYASQNQGAWWDGQPIRVSETVALEQSLLVTGFAYDPDRARSNLPHFSYLTAASRGVRRLGSAALDLAYVAAGRMDGYWEMDLGAWDWAAGILLVTEAGGRISQFDGEPLDLLRPTTLVASNGSIHAALLQALKRDPKDQSGGMRLR